VANVTLEDLLPVGREGYEFAPFEACASYIEPMDQITYLQEDESYRAYRVDQFLTILWHPHEERVIGIKIKGIRFLFESLRSIIKAATGKDYLSHDTFVPLVGAIEMALKVRGGAVWSEQLEKDRATELAALNKSYELARGVAKGVTIDARKIVKAS
jgi:hypothetical protein